MESDWDHVTGQLQYFSFSWIIVIRKKPTSAKAQRSDSAVNTAMRNGEAVGYYAFVAY